jgi:hypothetical protein
MLVELELPSGAGDSTFIDAAWDVSQAGLFNPVLQAAVPSLRPLRSDCSIRRGLTEHACEELATSLDEMKPASRVVVTIVGENSPSSDHVFGLRKVLDVRIESP